MISVRTAAVIATLICVSVAQKVPFPPWFKLGTASSSYQVEGAWNVSGKTESVWDRFLHERNAEENGDVATDSYHLWRRDVQMLDEIGVDFYRFSISWPRLLPTGFTDYINPDGIRYYSDLIDQLLEKGIEPLVTIFHWELPQVFQDMGGWTNPLITDWFADYARVVFSLFGDRVKTWLTINEPFNMCDLFYASNSWAPGIYEPDHSPFMCNKHILVAHGKAWRIYDEEFKGWQRGKVSIGNFLFWLRPQSREYGEFTELALQYINGRYFHPIYSEAGGWPRAIEEIIETTSLEQGYPRSRLPAFTEDEIRLVKGSYDFLALNYYTSRLVRPAYPDEVISPLFFEGLREIGAVMETSPHWPMQFIDILKIYPEGLRQGISWLQMEYGDQDVFVTECGYASAGAHDDDDRSQFIDQHLEQMLLSYYEDGVNVTGFTYWSLMDSFEWSIGYQPKFGLYHTNLSSPNIERTPRSSAEHYSSIIKNRCLNLN